MLHPVAIRITEFIAPLRGWRGKLACFIAGAATAGAFAPFYLWPVLFITLPFLFLMLDKARHARSAALYAWAFGYGYTMAGTYWIANALAVDMQQFGWLIPVSVLGLSLVLAIWFALFGALYGKLRTAHAGINLIRFAVLWVGVEYARSIGMFGFPWNLIGSAVLASERMAQSVSLLGTYGTGFLLLLLVLLPVLWLTHSSERLRQRAAVMALSLLIAAYGYGMLRMPEEAAMTTNRLRIVQGNIAQSLKWTNAGRAESLRVYSALTRMETAAPTPSIVVWPETAFPYSFRAGEPWALRLSTLVPNGVLLTGAVSADGEGEGYRLYNSIMAIDGAGRERRYDKRQLVPFGEFVPLRSLLPMEKITPGTVDFSRGLHEDTVAIGDVPPYLPLVCYEIIFPWMSASATRPAWIFNATNDAWYGNSPGPYQHYDAARLRALEQGVPVVRAANTGISAMIDPYGRAVRMLGLDERGIIDHALPRPLAPTLYARTGEWLALLLLGCMLVVTNLLLFRAKK